MVNHLHHVHIFASDIDNNIKFYKEFFAAKVILDTELAGARNIFLRIGKGRLHLYDQPPRNPGRGSIHHFGVQAHDIEGLGSNSTRIPGLFRVMYFPVPGFLFYRVL